MTLDELHDLVKEAGYHNQPLRVTQEFYDLLRKAIPAAEQVLPLGVVAPLTLTGVPVIVVTDGSENVIKGISYDDTWYFLPPITNIYVSRFYHWG